MNWRNYFFGFTGRINRARYWLFVVMAAPFLMALLLALWAYDTSFPGAYENGGPTPLPKDPLGIAAAILWGLALAATLIAGIAVTVKRLHDRDKAWWWVLIFMVAPNFLVFFGQYLLDTPTPNAGKIPMLCALLALLLSLWGFVELGLLRGTAGPNRYGPPA
jgi:uncharacterized membrane protein YhaH (DUF805 family)